MSKETLDKSQVKKDLERWAEKLRKIEALLREIYAEMNEIYKEVI